MRKDFLDGIRGWAAVMVLLSHLIQNFAVQAAPALNKPYLLFPSDGALAVYVFFVVSGFALSIGFFEKNDTGVLTSLAIRRYPRLTIPIFASALLGFVLMKSGLLYNQQASAIAHNESWLGGFFGFTPHVIDLLRFSLFDVYFAYDPEHTYNAVLWTMSVELWGSVFVFSLLAVLGTARRPLIYIIAFVCLFALRSPMLAFLLGVVISDLYASGRIEKLPSALASGASSAMIGAAILFSTFGRAHYDDPRPLSVIASILVAGVIVSVPMRSFFSNRVSRFFGAISFPLYLTHLPVICSLSSATFLALLAHGLSLQAASNWMVVTTIPATILVAMAFYPVETLSIEMARRMSRLFLTGRGATTSQLDRPVATATAELDRRKVHR
ncbi:acyltransferase family protein [Burkholderia cenocepacia]|uniref:acyltransferase family protein n=1 Tax=Burkholderia cenocepacia TaxID=95486 RepID=UPI00358FF42C